MTYLNGFVTPCETRNKDAYVESARAAWALLREYGALEQVEAWGEVLPAGTQTDFRRAVDLRDGETAVFSWVLWPDRATADACEQAMQTDTRFREMVMPFDAKRMIFGGFEPVFEARA